MQTRLTATDRELCSLIARAVFANPFGAEREALDRQLAGFGGGMARDELFARSVARAEAVLQRLNADGRLDLRLYAGEERECMRTVCLFDVYHRLRGAFDDLIRQQTAAGDTPCPVPFAGEAFALLAGRGFDGDESARYFAISYQMRRAFHFIETNLSGLAPAMRVLRQRLWDNIFTADLGRYEALLWNRMEDFSTLLLGETGTGKGAAAAAIGRSGYIPFDDRKGCFSESFTRNFIPLNLSQYPESLIESELFGHRKGAFTGAIGDHAGAFSRCTPHGSIFLDEIGDLSVPVQIKLLQILQERTFFPVGSHERQRFHGRVIAATHKPLDAMRRAGQFRDDFYYRLCSDIIVVPTLRERLQEEPRELAVLVRGILRRLLGEAGGDMAASVCATLERSVGPAYPWPGNVRELEQAVRRILVTGDFRGEPSPAAADAQQQLLAAVAAGSLDARQLLAGYCRLLYRRHGTIEEVARRTDLDRRTVKKYLEGDMA
jgi:hypothetical protein